MLDKTTSLRGNRIRPTAGFMRERSQIGISLVELLVAVAIGLMTSAAALGVLITTRNTAHMIGDATHLQQQASFLLRTIGSQIRPAGSLRVNLGPMQSEGQSVDVREPVTLESIVDGFNPITDSIDGYDTPPEDKYKLTVSYRNYKEELYSAKVATTQESQLANCLGRNSSDAMIQSQFLLKDNNELICADTNGSRVLARNVAEFSVRYAVQADSSASGVPTVKFTDAANASRNWGQVVGIEVCLVLFGDEFVDLPSESTYRTCLGSNNGGLQTKALADLTGKRRNRTHMTFSNVYQLRAQGSGG